jgi:hypothetical protein
MGCLIYFNIVKEVARLPWYKAEETNPLSYQAYSHPSETSSAVIHIRSLPEPSKLSPVTTYSLAMTVFRLGKPTPMVASEMLLLQLRRHILTISEPATFRQFHPMILYTSPYSDVSFPVLPVVSGLPYLLK